jgi:hypothetical protein
MIFLTQGLINCVIIGGDQIMSEI